MNVSLSLGPLGASRCCPLLPQQLFLQIVWKLTLIGSSRHCVHTEVLVASSALCCICLYFILNMILPCVLRDEEPKSICGHVFP